MQTADRFGDRVSDYVAHRPGYPATMMDLFRREMGVCEGTVVADIGCGPGISSIPFLDAGCVVIGVEPNEQMRNAARSLLGETEGFTISEGNAYDTALETGSADLVVAAQAFHWFNDEKAVAEFRRILRPGGFLALVWNERLLTGEPFLEAYEELLLEFGTDYKTVRHDKITIESLEELFGSGVSKATFENRQVLDLEGLMGRLRSSSYTPAEGTEGFGPMAEKAKELFAEHNESGRITISYDTNVFYANI